MADFFFLSEFRSNFSVVFFLPCSITEKLNDKTFFPQLSHFLSWSIDSILKMVHVMTKNFMDGRVLRIFSSVSQSSYLQVEMESGEGVLATQKIANCCSKHLKCLEGSA